MILADAGLVDSLAALAGVGALVLTAGMYVEFQRRRDKLTAIREAFEGVVASLASDEETHRLAGAILLRRFFDENSELGVRSLLLRRRTAPYAQEAVSVMAAVLRGLPTGNFQKLLADGLAYAPDLRGADLQRANLQNAYLGPHRASTALEGADFFRADLSSASLKGTSAARAVFYQARLNGTVFTNADLREANFYEADLTGARFSGALLLGANFKGAIHIPEELSEHLRGTEGVITHTNPVPTSQGSPTTGQSRRVFFSIPSRHTDYEQGAVERLSDLLRESGLTPEMMHRSEYPSSGQLSEVRRRITGCCGIVIFGFGRIETIETIGPHPRVVRDEIDPGRIRAEVRPTPWNHLEAGIGFALNIPMLVVAGDADGDGIFDTDVSERSIHRVPLDGLSGALTSEVRHWLNLVGTHEPSPTKSDNQPS